MTTTADLGIGIEVEPPHRRVLVRGLNQAENDVLAELEHVRTMLKRALAAAVGRDREASATVETAAAELTSRYRRAHDELMSLIALQTPVATDLRIAIALIHTNDRIARMGAQCTVIARLCDAMPTDARPSDSQVQCLTAMGGAVDRQLRDLASVFRDRDPAGVQGIRDQDERVNDRNRHCFELAIQDGHSEPRRRAGFFVAMMARALERIGDNAVDIARQAAFISTAQLPG